MHLPPPLWASLGTGGSAILRMLLCVTLNLILCISVSYPQWLQSVSTKLVHGGCGKVGVSWGQEGDSHTSFNSDNWTHNPLPSCYLTGASLIGSVTPRLALEDLVLVSPTSPSLLLCAITSQK